MSRTVDVSRSARTACSSQSTRRGLIERLGGWPPGTSGVVTGPTKPAGDRGDKSGPGPERRARSAELLEIFSLSDKKDESTRTLSGGMKRRLILARALMHRADLLLLD